MENSIYFDMDGIGIFSLFLKEFSPYGITYLNENDIKDFVEKLMCLYNLLDDGKTTIEALKEMDFYKFINANSFEEFIVNSEKVIVKNTAKALADWLTENLKEYKEISLLGI